MHPDAQRAVETWHHWSAGPVRQACFTPRDPADAIPLLTRSVPTAAFTCTAYALTRDPLTGPPHVRSTVRLGMPADQFWLTPDRVAAELGIRLHPASGRQSTGVRATLPLA